MACPRPVGPTCLRQLDTSNGCQDHTASPSASAPFVCRAACRSRAGARPATAFAPDAAASTASHPNVRDDRDTPLVEGGEGGSSSADFVEARRGVFLWRGL